MTDVSVIGTGLMGAAAARTLLRTGRTVTVWNRTPTSARDLERDGAVVADTASAALHASPVAVVVIKGYDVVHDLLQAASTEGPIGDLINLTTGTPAEADTLEAWTSNAGIALVDGAIFGFPSDMGSPHLSIMCAGDHGTFTRHQELITTLGGASAYVGPAARLANAWDVALLTVMNAAVVATMEGLALGLAHDLDADTLVAVFKGALHAQAASLNDARTLIDSDGADADDATVATWRGGVDAVVRAAADIGMRVRTAEAALATLADAEAAGFGRSNASAIVQERLVSRTTPGRHAPESTSTP